jgi:hypothetical protein
MGNVIKMSQKQFENIIEKVLTENENETNVGNEEEIKEDNTNKVPYGIYLGDIQTDKEGNEVMIIKSSGKSIKLGDLI